MADDLSPADLRVLVSTVVREMVGRSDDVRTETVRIASDDDLDAFVRRLLGAVEDPGTHDDLRSGRLRYRLEGRDRPHPSPAAAARRIERGAVTEREVTAAGDAGARLVLGPRAVLTPLARDKARALGVVVEKERG